MSFLRRVTRAFVREQHQRGLKQRLQDQAWEEAAVFIRGNWNRDCEFFYDWWKIREYAIKRASGLDGLNLEFGVFSGKTINFFAEILEQEGKSEKIYGFDNFRGLTESWSGFGLARGVFDRGGEKPKVRDNVELIVGDIKTTLPEFLSNTDEPIKFVHIDTDTYGPCKDILELLRPYLQEGTVILFDQLLGYFGYQEHELAALNETLSSGEYRFIGFGIAQETSNLVKAAIMYTGK